MKKNKTTIVLIAALISILGVVAFLSIPSKDSNPQTSPKKPTEFEISKKEAAEMSKWKKKTFKDMTEDALHGDPAGLHMIGECYLYGLLDLPINMQRANDFFAVAASLGFPPSINQIRAMYLDKSDSGEIENFLLSMVYTNLVASSGHYEYTMSYHDIRSELSAKLGTATFEEIERIALNKKLAIENNLETLEEITDLSNKKRFIGQLFATGGLLEEDSKYSPDYWISTYSKRTTVAQ